MGNRCVIVGASLAGVAAAEAIRERDDEAEIVLLGEEPHIPYDRPPLSKELLQGTREADGLGLREAGWAADLGIDLRTDTRATEVRTDQATLVLDDDEKLAYDRLLIATGAVPRRLPAFEGIEGVHVLRTLDDAIAVRRAIGKGGRLAVIGGGFIGLEVAASARRCGMEVTVVEMLDTLLARAVGPDVGTALDRLHRAQGVEVCTATAVAGPIVEDGRIRGVRLEGGETLAVDAVVVGIGVVPATGWIGDPAIEVDDGVLVDAALQSSVPGVFAAGDVARVQMLDGTSRRIEHWATAVEQGRTAGGNMLSEPDEFDPWDQVPTFWSDQYDAKIRSAGIVVDPTRVEVVEYTEDPLKLVALATDTDDVLTGIITVGRASALAKCRPLFGQPGSVAAARSLVVT